MALFSRKSRSAPEPDRPPSAEATDDVSDHGGTLSPTAVPIGEAERQLIDRCLAELEAERVDVEDLESLGAGFDAAYTAWARSHAGEHGAIVERYGVGIGEHLQRHTDLDWQIVTDAFGTDLGLAGGLHSDFVVVPSNLVAGRWMRGETGWLPGVVGHLVRRRDR